MSIRFATPDTARHVTFGSLNYGKVFKVPGDDSYYLKTPVFAHCGNTCNRIELSSGQPMRALDGSDLVTPVTLEAKEVYA